MAAETKLKLSKNTKTVTEKTLTNTLDKYVQNNGLKRAIELKIKLKGSTKVTAITPGKA